MKKKVNMFGKTIPVFAFVILGLALVSAALVPYLSNTVTGNVIVDYAAEVNLAKLNTAKDYTEYTAPVNLDNDISEEGWVSDLSLADTHQLSTSLIAVQIINNADVTLENKVLKLTVSSTLNDVNCDDIESLMFLDTATKIQLDKNYQQLAGVGLCNDLGGTVVYNIPINSLASKQTYEYPVKITFGVVNPTTYTLTAQMNTVA